VNVYKFLKQLKKKLRWRRRWLALGLIVLTICVAVNRFEASQSIGNNFKEDRIRSAYVPAVSSVDTENQSKVIESIHAIKGKQNAFLQKVYVCGEETQQLGVWNSKELLEAHKKHPNWLIRINEPDKVTFIEYIEDLSPTCKEQAYFGVDETGNLSLFHGAPGKDNVIRTFFQLNIHYLESSLPKETVKELHQGIRITDMAEYNSVLSTFSDYAVEDIEKAMSP
jgi:forespore regulator of the sigma-K checkpoint